MEVLRTQESRAQGWQELQRRALPGQRRRAETLAPCRVLAGPIHLAESPNAAHAHGAGARAEAHPERKVGREDDVIVLAGHAFGVHGKQAVRRVPRAPQARVVPRETVRVEEERSGTWAGMRF